MGGGGGGLNREWDLSTRAFTVHVSYKCLWQVTIGFGLLLID